MKQAWNAIGLLVSVALVMAAAAFGGLFTPGDWYTALEKPAFTPPGAVIGTVWTVLYLTMAVAAWLVWLRREEKPVEWALAAFAAQLVLNAMWSWVFFGLHAMGAAFAELCVLWCGILVTLLLFWRVSRLAGALLIPYLCWVAFAGFLNFTLWRMNAG